MAPHVTAAITLNFRKSHLTVTCVRGLIADGWEPILVWDNSADGGADADSLREALKDESSVHVVESSSNIGFAQGVNRAMEWLERLGVAGDVLLINNDAQIMMGARDALCSALKRTKVGLIAPLVEHAGESIGWMYYQPVLGLVGRHRFWAGIPYLSGCCLLINREVIRGSVFDEAFFMYGEDVELSHRVHAMGLGLTLVPEVLVTHIGAASSGNGSAFYEWYLVRAHWLLASKISSGLMQSLLFRAIRLPVLATRAIARSIRYRSPEPIRALRAILPGRGMQRSIGIDA